jgi:hypothetical protein
VDQIRFAVEPVPKDSGSGCGSTDIRITAEDDVVHWDWFKQKP